MDIGNNFNMKAIGFIKEINPVKGAVGLLEVSQNPESGPDAIIVIKHLANNGHWVFGWMGYFSDPEDNSLICPNSYYTDGVYFWPSYLPYFLNKYPGWKLDEDFMCHIRSACSEKISQKELGRIEDIISVFIEDID